VDAILGARCAPFFGKGWMDCTAVLRRSEAIAGMIRSSKAEY